MDNPSISEANKMLRVLNGTKLKYTVRVIKADGKVVEFQSDKAVQVKWNDSLRAPWIEYTGYDGSEIMPFEQGTIVLTEENPKA